MTKQTYRVSVLVRAYSAKDAIRVAFTDNKDNPFKAELFQEAVVKIEVGGDHGDGNVEVVSVPDGVKVIVTDFDNASLNPDDPDGDLIPEVREWV